ncbi:class I SAM-dependent methyltransferase [Candidatus Gottesmanbacteria bacterium]|nr:class I SAM-dependent methyltransferase [Candidatus Gottesmanbacteria bacterium]
MDHASLTTLESMNQALWYNRWTLNKFAAYLHGDILEVGCGIGNFTPALGRYGRVWAFDIDAHAVSQTKKRVKRDASVGLGDIERGSYFFKNKKFSTLVCLNVLEHVSNDKQALANMRQLLVPGGHLILLVPIHASLFGTIDNSIGHFRRYKPQALITEVKHQGFQILSQRKLNLFGAIGWYITGKLLKRTSVNNSYIRLFNLFSPILLPLEDIIAPPFGTSLLLIARRRKRTKQSEAS